MAELTDRRTVEEGLKRALVQAAACAAHGCIPCWFEAEELRRQLAEFRASASVAERWDRQAKVPALEERA